MDVKPGDESMIQENDARQAHHDFYRDITKKAYLSGVVIILGSAYAQYLFGGPRSNPDLVH